MKNYLLFIIVVISFMISCSKEVLYDSSSNSTYKDQYFPAEQFMPNSTRDIITLQNGFVVEKIDSLYILGGDMILNKDQIEMLNSPKTRGAIIKDFAKYWPDGKVYYSISSDFGSDYAVLQAMNMISDVAEIEFIQRTNQPNYIYFVPSPLDNPTNSSYIGMQGGGQNITIYNRNIAGVIAHEIMHSLGVYHEMSRSDRDDYITINWNNIDPKYSYNFEQYSLGFDIGYFDFNSIMMYSSPDFLKDNIEGYSFTRKNGQPIYGQRSYLSETDQQSLRFIYGPLYYKIDIDTDVYQDSGLDYESYNESTTHLFTFYQDADRTIPITLHEDRLIKATVTTVRSTGSGSSTPNVTNEYLVIPAGTTTYIYNGDRYYYNIDRGELRESYCRSTSFSKF